MLEHQKTSTVARPDGFSSSHSVSRADTPNGERRWAVLVGINDYRGAANDLPSCVNDVNAFEELLEKKYCFNQFLRLVNSEATIANVTAALRELCADASPADRLVFFYS
ncbi:caspase family protein, partial [Rhizobium leguminosarum]